MYKKLFELSGLKSTEISKRLNIGRTQYLQYQRSVKIDVEKFVTFAKKLGISNEEATDLVVNEIKNLLCTIQ